MQTMINQIFDEFKTVVEEGRKGKLNEQKFNEILEELRPRKNEFVIAKDKPSAFFGTPLVSRLQYFNVDTLIITGMVTSGCVRATVVDAFSHNYFIIIPEEGVADRGDISHQVSLFDMHMKYADVLHLPEVAAYLQGFLKKT